MKVLQELISAGFKRATLQEHSTEERLGERPFNSHPKYIPQSLLTNSVPQGIGDSLNSSFRYSEEQSLVRSG